MFHSLNARIETVVQIDHHMAFNASFETEAKVVGLDPDSPESEAEAIYCEGKTKANVLAWKITWPAVI